MKQALSEEKSPLDACLESVLPGVHQWHHANQAAVSTLANDMRSMNNNMNHGFSQVIEELQETRRQRVAQEKSFATLLDMGRRVLLTGEPLQAETPLLSPSKFLNEGTPLCTRLFDTPSSPVLDCTPKCASDQHKTYIMKPKHATLVDLYSEWIGIGDFHDGFGGIEGRNKTMGPSWRKHLSAYTYSRTERTVKGIRQFAKQNGLGELDACRDLQQVYAQQRCSVKNMVDYFTAEGLLSKRKPRGKPSKANMVSPSQDELEMEVHEI
ncbi:MAG: hypothetical protein ACRCZI_13770 [Cetobacterium sp.]